MKTTKKQFKNLALQIMCLLASRQVDEDYANTWYHIIACDFVLGFEHARLTDYQLSIERLSNLPIINNNK